MKMTNSRNKFIYHLWAPIYDSTVGLFFEPGRRRAMQVLNLKAGERVLLIGVGTGADLPFLPGGVEAVGIDCSPAMLAKARMKLGSCKAHIQLIEGDAQQFLGGEDHFDAVILNLILSVIPDGQICLKTALRTLKPGGRIVIFDKFLPEKQKLSLGRRFLNGFSTAFGTDINRAFSDMVIDCPCVVVSDEASLLGGNYRVILLKKM